MIEPNSEEHGVHMLSDDELLGLELAIESGESFDTEGNRFSQRDQHRLAYQLIHNLSAPVRTAIAAVDRPPQLHDYEELSELARGGMGVVYQHSIKRHSELTQSKSFDLIS